MSITFPLIGGGTNIIGTPFVGTHSKATNVAGGSDNWQSENAVDLATPVGTIVVAVVNGTIARVGTGAAGTRFAGSKVTIIGDDGNQYFYAHLSLVSVRDGQHVTAGQTIGRSGSANGVAHLHFAVMNGDPVALVKAASKVGGGSGVGGVPNPLDPLASLGQAIADGLKGMVDALFSGIKDILAPIIDKLAGVFEVAGGGFLMISGITIIMLNTKTGKAVGKVGSAVIGSKSPVGKLAKVGK